MTTIRRSVAYSLAESYFSVPLQLISTMIISRLLTPEEAGVFAVAAVFASLASTVRDFGVAEYLIQERELTAEKLRAALTVNLAISWGMGLLLFAGAPLAAGFYRSEGVAEVMRVQAFNFVLIPFGAVTMAKFRRDLDFRPIFFASVLANTTSFIVATLCAWAGLGYMSLAWSSLAGVVVTVGTSIWFRPADCPKWPGLKGVGRVIQFGKFASGIYIFGQLGKGAPEMIIGRAQDMVGVALFSRASGLVELFHRIVLRAILPVCLPYFAKSCREQGSIRQAYLLFVSYLTVIGWSFFAFVATIAFAAIRIFYGPQWTAAVPLAQILCLVGAVELIHCLSKEALIAVGDVKRSNALQVGVQLSRVAGLCAVIPFGLEGAAWGLFAAAIVGTLGAQLSLAGRIELPFREVIHTCLPSLYIAVVSTAPVGLWVLVEGLSEANFLSVAFGGGVITGAVWVLALRCFKHPLWNEITVLLARLVDKYRARRQ